MINAAKTLHSIYPFLVQNHATPQWMLEQGFSKTFATRFWKKVRMSEGCWIWIGSTVKGYGQIRWSTNQKDPQLKAHRASWMLANGQIEGGLFVLHKCPNGSNTLCVNPSHLYLGTDTDNIRDAYQEGRRPSGENHPWSKLSERALAEVRQLIATGIKDSEIAIQFGVSRSLISLIRLRKIRA